MNNDWRNFLNCCYVPSRWLKKRSKLLHNICEWLQLTLNNFPDPNIPETGQQRRKSSTGDEDCCYTHCGSSGRGRRDGSQPSNIPDSDPGAKNYILGICEHCPGRPPNQDGAAASRATRTINQVSLLWTSLIVTIFYILQTTENVFRALLLRCLLYSVRTVYRHFFKIRTHS